MSDALLRATRALRAKYDDMAAEPASERERMLELARARMRRRRVSRALLLPIAAAFLLLATWAAAAGWAKLFTEPLEHGGTIETPPPPASIEVAGAAPSTSTSASAPIVSAEPTATVVPTSARAAPPGSVAAAVSVQALTPARDSEEDRLYADAHRAHFGEHDYARALAAWDAYLGYAEHGRLAPEARYNRALCLVRLGRLDEGKAALAPFARGDFQGYRQAEAQGLLDAMESDGH